MREREREKREHKGICVRVAPELAIVDNGHIRVGHKEDLYAHAVSARERALVQDPPRNFVCGGIVQEGSVDNGLCVNGMREVEQENALVLRRSLGLVHVLVCSRVRPACCELCMDIFGGVCVGVSE